MTERPAAMVVTRGLGRDYVTGANVRVDGGLGLHSWSVDHPEQLYRATPTR